MPATMDSLDRKFTKLNITIRSGRAELGHLFCARVARELADEAYEWCEGNFDDNWIWSSPIHTDYTDFYFKESENAFLFKLKFKSA